MHKSTQYNSYAKVCKSRSIQTNPGPKNIALNLNVKKKNSTTQTLKQPKPTVVVTKHALTQCMFIPEKRDFKTQTLTLNVDNSSQTDEVIANSVETGVFTGDGSSFLKEVADRSLALHLHIRCSSNFRGENSLTVTNPRRVGLMEIDIDPVQATFTSTGQCTVVIPFQDARVTQLYEKDKELSTCYDFINEVLNLVDGKDIKYCPGIKHNEELANGPGFLSFENPCKRVQSKRCKVLYKSLKHSKRGQCESCQKSSKILYIKRKRKKQLTPEMKAKRCETESKCPITYLNADSLRKRYLNMAKTRRSLYNRISKLEAQLKHKDSLLNVG